MPSPTDPPLDLCPQCGQKPGKPKFCSQSCSASFNNRRSPKRGPQGKCKDCDAPIPTAKTRCPGCAAKAAEVKRRAEENVQTFRTPAGEIRELPVQKAWVHDHILFEPHPYGGRRFTPADPCGDFLDALLGVVFARPAYIRPDDIHRYAAWIDAFRSHVIDRPWGNGVRSAVAVLPLHDLTYALRTWVDSIVFGKTHVLFPTLALDAARFVEAHADGYYDHGSETWRVAGMVPPNPLGRGGRNQLAEPRLKHEITGRLKGTPVRCAIPPGGCVPGRADVPQLLGPGEAFVFEIERCHLTRENATDRPCVRAVEGDPPRFDIAADLWFRGAILFDTATARPLTCLTSRNDPSWQWNRREIWAEIPVRWITDVYEWLDDGRLYRLRAVPKWEV